MGSSMGREALQQLPASRVKCQIVDALRVGGREGLKDRELSFSPRRSLGLERKKIYSVLGHQEAGYSLHVSPEPTLSLPPAVPGQGLHLLPLHTSQDPGYELHYKLSHRRTKFVILGMEPILRLEKPSSAVSKED